MQEKSIYIPYNLIIEVKAGGNNKNNKESPSMKASREKTVAKEKLVTDKGAYNYICLTNNEFQQLLGIFLELKEKSLKGDESRTIRIHESAPYF